MKQFILYLLMSLSLFSQGNGDYQIFGEGEVRYKYKSPKAFDFFFNAIQDYSPFLKESFASDNLGNLAWITASTGLLIYYDQELLDEAQRFGRRIGLGNEDKTKTYFSIGETPVFRGPSDWGSAMYYIGDGWTHMSLGLGFYAYGAFYNDYRALQTASQIAEGMLTTAFMTQLIKHITGRESPFRSSRDRGRWVPFPNQVDYHKNVSKYDAFPSGHIATFTMTLTVISENYFEYKWIDPLAYVLGGLLMYQMMNNGVHWASDYPLGIAIGYLFGKIAVRNGRERINSNNRAQSWTEKLKIFPMLSVNRSYALGLSYQF